MVLPVSVVGQPQVVLDFAGLPDGPFPPGWVRVLLADDGTGVKTGVSEPTPDTYFKVAGGLGWWDYTRVPAVPGPSVPFDEHGYAASPVGVLTSRDARVGVSFVSPPRLLDIGADEFVLEVIVGLRASDDATVFVGARARAEWSAGIWTTPIALEIVQASGGLPVVLVSAVFDDLNTPIDAWLANPFGELLATLREGTFVAALNGIAEISAAVPDAGGQQPFVFVRVFNRTGSTLVSPPSVAEVRLLSLRDAENPGPTPAIAGDWSLVAPQLPMTRLPLQGLTDADLFARKGARVFEAVKDVEIDVMGTKNLFRQGERVIAVEPFVGQDLVPIYADLAGQRARRVRGGGP